MAEHRAPAFAAPAYCRLWMRRSANEVNGSEWLNGSQIWPPSRLTNIPISAPRKRLFAFSGSISIALIGMFGNCSRCRTNVCAIVVGAIDVPEAKQENVA